jgi:hypothetical protein
MTLTRFRIQFKRIVRRLIWARPALYAPIGILRNRGNVFRTDHRLYISGFPRSGNSFAVKAFQHANPGVAVRSHRHIPAFVVQSVRDNMPGMVLIRTPIDAAISWAIFMGQSLRQTLAYYTDYHSVLVPYREALFLIRFEDVTCDFGKVTASFNERWNTQFVPFEHTPENVARCMAQIETEYVDDQGAVMENKVPRPSTHRQLLKETFLRQLNRSSVWQQELHRANELYQLLAPKRFVPRNPAHKTTTTQSIRLRPAT